MEKSTLENRVVVRKSDERVYFDIEGEDEQGNKTETRTEITMENVDDTNIPLDLRFKYLRNAYRALSMLHNSINDNVSVLQTKLLDMIEKNSSLQLQGMQNVSDKMVKDGVIHHQLEKANREKEEMAVRITELMSKCREYKLAMKQLRDSIQAV